MTEPSNTPRPTGRRTRSRSSDPHSTEPAAGGDTGAGRAFHEPDGDVVPGDPPVPITVWHLPRPVPGSTVPAAVVRRLIVNYTAPDATIVDLTTLPPTTPTSSRAGSHAGSRTLPHLGRPVDLIVSSWPVDPPTGADEYLAGCAAHLAGGGCLALVLAVSDTPDHLGDLVAAGRSAGLTYLQHVVVAHHLGASTSPTDRSDVEVARRRARHLRVHTDVLLFRQPGPRG